MVQALRFPMQKQISDQLPQLLQSWILSVPGAGVGRMSALFIAPVCFATPRHTTEAYAVAASNNAYPHLSALSICVNRPNNSDQAWPLKGLQGQVRSAKLEKPGLNGGGRGVWGGGGGGGEGGNNFGVIVGSMKSWAPVLQDLGRVADGRLAQAAPAARDPILAKQRPRPQTPRIA